MPLRRAWLKTEIIVRADSGFCRPRVPQKNSRLNEQVALAEMAPSAQYAAKATEQWMFCKFD